MRAVYVGGLVYPVPSSNSERQASVCYWVLDQQAADAWSLIGGTLFDFLHTPANDAGELWENVLPCCPSLAWLYDHLRTNDLDPTFEFIEQAPEGSQVIYLKGGDDE